MVRSALPAVVLLLFLLQAVAAWAVDVYDVPFHQRVRLPDGFFNSSPPGFIDCLTCDDIDEFIAAYECGVLTYVAECRVLECRGWIEPDCARTMLGVETGSPFILDRFVRLAKHYHGRGDFSDLKWSISANSDDSVSIDLYYASGRTEGIYPQVQYNTIAGVLVGGYYENTRFRDGDRRLIYGLEFNQKDERDARIYAELTDNELNNGRNGFRVAADLANDWRGRKPNDHDWADLRHRTARLDAMYFWLQDPPPGHRESKIGAGAGYYEQDMYVYKGDPFQNGTAPRADFDQSDGAGAYVAVELADTLVDHKKTPAEGHRVTARVESHLGDWDFNRLVVDARKYWPMPNILGIKADPVVCDGCVSDIRRLYAPASFAVQVKAGYASGDVPFFEEFRLGGQDHCRGYGTDHFVGTRMITTRLEYRFTLDRDHENELFVFSDHAAVGESVDELESLNSVGVGGLFTFGFMGDMKAGGFMGTAMDGSEWNYGIAFGYMF